MAYIQLFSKTLIGHYTCKSPCNTVILRFLTRDRSVKFGVMVTSGVIEYVYSLIFMPRYFLYFFSYAIGNVYINNELYNQMIAKGITFVYNETRLIQKLLL